MAFPLRSVGQTPVFDPFLQPPPAHQPAQPAACELKPYEQLELPNSDLPNIPRRQRGAVLLEDLATGASELGRVLLGAAKKNNQSSDSSDSSSSAESSDNEPIKKSNHKPASSGSSSSSERSDDESIKKSKLKSDSSSSSESSGSPKSLKTKRITKSGSAIAEACLQTKLRVIGAGALAVGAGARMGKRQLDHERDQAREEYDRKLGEDQRNKKYVLVQAGFNRESNQQANSERLAVQKETNYYNLNITKEQNRRDASFWKSKNDALKTCVEGQVMLTRDREQGRNERRKTAAQQVLAQRGLELEHEEKKLDTAAQLIERHAQGSQQIALTLIQQKNQEAELERNHSHKMLETVLGFAERTHARTLDAVLPKQPKPQPPIHPMLKGLEESLKNLKFSYEEPSDLCFEGLSIYQLLTGDVDRHVKNRINNLFEHILKSQLNILSKSGQKITKTNVLNACLSSKKAHEFFTFIICSTLSCPLNVRTILLGELFKTYSTSFKFLES